MKLQLTTRIEKEVLRDLEETAAGAHTEPTKYAAQVLSELSRLKPEYALRWIQHIPLDYYRRRPGRPTGSTNSETARQQSAEDQRVA